LANGTVLEHDFKVDFYPSEYLQPGRLEHIIKLWISDDELPPEYDGGASESFYTSELTQALKLQRRLTVNLRNIPNWAFYKRVGPYGEYYGVEYELGLVFGPSGIEFRLLYGGKVVGSVDCDYD
jgi:hypothetical protein